MLIPSYSQISAFPLMMGRDQSGTLARFRSAKESSESTSSKIAQMREPTESRQGLLLGVDRTYGDIMKPTQMTQRGHGGAA